jgi:UDP-2,4-diacetamido-2,4,6-trideoxy-beta-L-altropyranose hydrolase
MKFLFRCDSSYKIGSGHLTRCLNLAKQLHGEVHFICRSLNGNINSLVNENQFTLHEIDSKDVDIEETIEEIQEVTQLFKKIQPDVIIVDHYGLGKSWERNAELFSNKILIIDDLDRRHIKANILDQNYRNSPPKFYKESDSNLFLGPEYCLLAKQFRKDNVDSIMIFFGGSDIHSQTLRMVKLINRFPLDINWEIVIGAQNKDLKKIRDIAITSPNINVHFNIDYMADLMLSSDLFFGAGGSTSWERAKVGLPSLCMSLAENQVGLAENLHEQGSCDYLGKHTEVSDKMIINKILFAVQNQVFRKRLTDKGLSLQVGSKFCTLLNFLTD